MDTDPYFSSTVFQSHLIQTDTEAEENGDEEIGVLTMTYQISYRTDAFVAPTDPDDFVTAQAEYNLGNNQAPDDQTRDDITVQAP